MKRDKACFIGSLSKTVLKSRTKLVG